MSHRNNILLLLSAVMLVCAPLYASGKSVYAILGLELLAGLVLIVLLMGPTSRHEFRLSPLIWLFIFISFLVPLLYLIPVPVSVWESLPGRQTYAESLTWLQTNGQTPWLALSIVPQKTLHGMVALLPALALFLAVSVQTEEHKRKLVYIFLLMAVCQAILGMLQYSSKSEIWFFNDTAHYAVGTYLNRNHYAALIYMALPLAVGLLAARIGQSSKRRKRHAEVINQNQLIWIIILSLSVLAFIAAGLFSASRTGIFLTVAAVILSTLLFARHVGGKANAGLTSTLAALAVGLVFSTGMIPIANRFLAANPFEDARGEIFTNVIAGIKQFFPLGSGPTTFQEIYLTLQPIEQLNFINHAHNDYLELLFETGAAGVVIILLFFIIYISGWLSLKGQPWNEMRFIRVASGISILLLLLHSFTSFNLHTPANALIFAMLCALFLSSPPKEKRHTR